MWAGWLRQSLLEDATAKPNAGYIPISAPLIIASDEFEAVQARPKAQNPVTPARVITDPIRLAGRASRSTHSGAMMLRSGTSGLGQVHRYSRGSKGGARARRADRAGRSRIDTHDMPVAELSWPICCRLTDCGRHSRSAARRIAPRGRTARRLERSARALRPNARIDSPRWPLDKLGCRAGALRRRPLMARARHMRLNSAARRPHPRTHCRRLSSPSAARRAPDTIERVTFA